MKIFKIIFFVFVLLLTFIFILAVWQPDRVKEALLREALERVNQEGTYQVATGPVRGNFFRTIIIEDVRINMGGQELLTVEELSLKVDWRSLLKRRLRLHHFSLHKPVLTLVFGPDKKWVLPASKAQNVPDSKPFAITVDAITIKAGLIKMVNESVNPSQRVTLESAAFEGTLAQDSLEIRKGEVRLGEGETSMTGKLSLAASTGNIFVEMDRWPFEKFLDFYGVTSPVPLTYSGDSTFDLGGNEWKATSEGRLSGRPFKAQVRYKRPDNINAKISWEHFNASLNMVGGKGDFSLDGSVPGMQARSNGNLDLSRKEVDLVFNAAVEDLSHLSFVRKDLAEVHGKVEVQGKISGPFKKLSVQGQAKLENVDFKRQVGFNGDLYADILLADPWRGKIFASIPELNIVPVHLGLKNVRMRVDLLENTTPVFELTGDTKKGNILIRGRSRFPALNLNISGNSVEMSSGPWSAEMDAGLSLLGTLSSPQITGSVQLKEGAFQVSKAQKMSSKEKDNTPKPPSSLWLQTVMDVRIFWPRNVWVRTGASGVETEGDLYLRKERLSDKIFPAGEIKSVRGNFSHLGRTFNIESGRITFTGPPVVDPLLDIRAVYRSRPTEVILQIQGTAQSPELLLTSNPPMSDQDILSILAFGVPAGQLNVRGNNRDSTGSSLVTAGQVLGSYLSGKISERGLEKLNLDVLNIQPTKSGAEVTVGRYIGEKLFITYGQSLERQGGRKISAEYSLTPAWSLHGEAGTEQRSLDLLFRIPLNRGNILQLKP